MKSLIHIRKKYGALKSSEIQWKNTKGRLVSYVRPGDETVEVYINAGEQQVATDLQEQEIVFARGYKDYMLFAGGVLIVRRNLQ